jgi:hypothetical protein
MPRGKIGKEKVKKVMSLCLTKHYAMKMYEGVNVQIHAFLTFALVGGEWSDSHPCRFIPGERAPGTHWIRCWVGPTAGTEDMEKWTFLTLPGLESRHFGRSADSQSLYRLRYRGIWRVIGTFAKGLRRTGAWRSIGMYRSDGRFWPVVLCCAVVRRKSASLRLVSMPSDTVSPE